MSEPLVSIVIPTYNSEKTLPLCLASIKKQTYKNIEVIVVDSYSIDRTVSLAKRFGAKVIQTHGGLLWARYLGHLHAKGEIELLLDSDQILEPTAIERGVKMILKGCDALILEETSYKPKTLTQWLFYFDRKYVHDIKDYNPVHGVLLARMYLRDVLNKSFEKIRSGIPLKIMYNLISQDHALIYYETWNYIKRLCILKNAVFHIESSTLSQIIKKFYRYGRTELSLSSYYPELLRGKRTPRKPSTSPAFILSLVLWLIKACSYSIGLVLSENQ